MGAAYLWQDMDRMQASCPEVHMYGEKGRSRATPNNPTLSLMTAPCWKWADKMQTLWHPPQPPVLTALSGHRDVHVAPWRCAGGILPDCTRQPAVTSECSRCVKWIQSFGLGYQVCILVTSFVSQIFIRFYYMVG